MIYLSASNAEDLEALEAEVWVENLKWVSNTHWGGKLMDVTVEVPAPEYDDEGNPINEFTDHIVNVADLSFDELNDRDRFPLFGYVGGKHLNTKTGYTKCGDVARQSQLDSDFYMKQTTDERVLAIYESVKENHPTVLEVEIDPSEHWPEDAD